MARLLACLLVAVAAPQLLQAGGRMPLITTDIAPNRLGQDWLDYCATTGTRRSSSPNTVR